MVGPMRVTTIHIIEIFLLILGIFGAVGFMLEWYTSKTLTVALTIPVILLYAYLGSIIFSGSTMKALVNGNLMLDNGLGYVINATLLGFGIALALFNGFLIILDYIPPQWIIFISGGLLLSTSIAFSTFIHIDQRTRINSLIHSSIALSLIIFMWTY